jgi:hypothetical protein
MLFDNIEAGINLVTVLWIVSVANNGYTVNHDDIPSWFGFVHYWQILKYALPGMIQNEFDTFDEEDCGTAELCDVDNFNFEFSLSGNLWGAFLVSLMWSILALLSTILLARRIRAK